MNVFLVADQCEDNYVVTCNPAPKTPASEVIVKTVTDTLAATGGNTDAALWWVGGFLIVTGVILFTLNEMKKRDRKNDE